MIKTKPITPNTNCKNCYGSGRIYYQIPIPPFGSSPRECNCVAEKVAQYEGLAREAKKLLDSLEILEPTFNTEQDFKGNRAYGKAAKRLRRRLNILKQAGHTESLW